MFKNTKYIDENINVRPFERHSIAVTVFFINNKRIHAIELTRLIFKII